jgi:hypothetical protein
MAQPTQQPPPMRIPVSFTIAIRPFAWKGPGMTEKLPPRCQHAQRETAMVLASLTIPEQAAVLAEAMSQLLAHADADDIGVALFVETVCEVVPDRVRAIRAQADRQSL